MICPVLGLTLHPRIANHKRQHETRSVIYINFFYSDIDNIVTNYKQIRITNITVYLEYTDCHRDPELTTNWPIAIAQNIRTP